MQQGKSLHASVALEVRQSSPVNLGQASVTVK